MNWSKFFLVGGYGLYVWGSYGVTFVLLGGEVLMLLKRKRDIRPKRASLGNVQIINSQLENSFQEIQ